MQEAAFYTEDAWAVKNDTTRGAVTEMTLSDAILDLEAGYRPSRAQTDNLINELNVEVIIVRAEAPVIDTLIALDFDMLWREDV